jgi:AcrR family transcriptional regulator
MAFMGPDNTERFLKLLPEKQRRILDAAIREFADKGYAGASMNRVVEDAGISKGALFQYFGSKASLFMYVYRKAFDLVKMTLRTVRDKTRQEDFFDRLELLMAAGMRFIEDHPALARIYYHLIYTGDSPFKAEILRELNRESHRFLVSLVEQGIERGELRKDLDPAVAAFLLQSVLDRFLQAKNPAFMGLPIQSASSMDEGRMIKEIASLFRLGMGNQERGKRT